jgi:hypothetical protein
MGATPWAETNQMETLIALMIATGLLGMMMSQLPGRSSARSGLIPIRLRTKAQTRRHDPGTAGG